MSDIAKAETYLSKSYYCYFKDKDILVVAEDKSVLPFLYVLVDPHYKNTLLLSFAIDFPFPSRACVIGLELSNICNIAVAEDFYISKSGSTFWGDEANKILQFDTQLPLEELDMSKSVKH